MAIDLRANEEKKTQCEVNLMNFYSFSESAIGWKKQHTHYKLSFTFWMCFGSAGISFQSNMSDVTHNSLNGL